jgi:hypothetical protein
MMDTQSQAGDPNRGIGARFTESRRTDRFWDFPFGTKLASQCDYVPEDINGIKIENRFR